MRRTFLILFGLGGVALVAGAVFLRRPLGLAVSSRGAGNATDVASEPAQSPAGTAPEIARPEADLLSSLEAELREERPYASAAPRFLIELHHRLLSKDTRSQTVAAFRSAWPTLSPLAKILVALLVGGFSDAEISEFRASLLKEADPRVRVFVARTFMMDEVDETPCAITDEEERLRMRLAGHAVPGFNAKGYRFFWDCVFYEIRWKMRESFPWAECEGWFFEKYPQYYATKTTGEVRLYNECFAHQLTQPWVREELLAPFRHITPSDGKSALFNILIYRSDAKVPDDMRQICMDMALNVTEDVGNRWECIRRLRNSDIKDPALFFRNVLILEMSQAAPCHRLACKILAGILKEKPRELFENPRTRSLVATVVGALARSEQDYDHAALGEVAVTLLDADPSNREILEGVASSLGVEAAQRIRAEIEKYRTRPQR